MIIFASDFHLSEANPGGVATFLSFLENRVKGAESFYILGDLFNLWIGPAQLETPGLEPVFAALQKLAAEGTRIFIFHGNRDFLLGDRESSFLNADIPGESMRTTIEGKKAFLTHGDLFCTSDRAYQRMKKVIRSPLARGLSRLLPSFAIRVLARGLRRKSIDAVAAKGEWETTLCLEDVDAFAAGEGLDLVICGHVHKADDLALGCGARLVVLSEWRAGRGFYAVSEGGEVVLREFSAESTRPDG